MKRFDGDIRPLAPVALASLPETPLVSVVISNYNYALYLERAVRSVLDQSYEQLEIIICDDGSTDGSRAIIEHLSRAEARVRAIFQPNQGQAAAWNAAVAVARGEIICFLDPDDWCEPGKVAALVAAFRECPSAGVACHRLQQVAEGGERVGIAIPRKLDRGVTAGPVELLRKWGQWPPTSGFAIRREIAERIFPIPRRFRGGHGDAYVQATARFLTEVAAIDAALGVYQIHSTNFCAALRPSPHSVATILESLAPLMSEIAAFLGILGRPDLGEQLRVDRIGMYWEHQLALDLLSGSLVGRARLRALRQPTGRIPSARRRWLWRGLLVLPPSVARWALSASWSATRWRKVSSVVATRLGA